MHGRALVRRSARGCCRSTAMGLNQSSQGTAKNAALINLHLATGQIGRPAPARSRSPASRTRWAAARSAAWRTCCPAHRDLAERRRIAPRSRALWGVDDVPATPGQDRGRDVRGRAPTARSSCCGSRARTPRSRCPTRRWCAQRSSAPSSSCCRKRSRRPRPRRSPTCCCRRRPGARRKARSPTPSAASRACARRCRAAGEARARLAHRRRRSRAASRRGCGRARRRCSRTTTPEAILNEHRATTRGRDLDITGLSLRAARARRPAAMAVSRRRDAAASAAAVRRRRLRHRRRPRALLRRRRPRPPAEPRDARYPFSPHHRPPARPVARHEPHRHARPPVRPRARARRSTVPAGHGAAEPGRRRPRARRHRAAASWCCRPRRSDGAGLGAGLHRDALGRGGADRPRRGRRSVRRHQRADDAGVLPAVAGSPSSSTAPCASRAPSCPGGCARWPGCRRTRRWRGASACARCWHTSAMRAACRSGASRDAQGRVGLWLDAAAADVPAGRRCSTRLRAAARPGKAEARARLPRPAQRPAARAARRARRAGGSERLAGFWVGGADAPTRRSPNGGARRCRRDAAARDARAPDAGAGRARGRRARRGRARQPAAVHLLRRQRGRSRRRAAQRPQRRRRRSASRRCRRSCAAAPTAAPACRDLRRLAQQAAERARGLINASDAP